jgi:hypothetical protein
VGSLTRAMESGGVRVISWCRGSDLWAWEGLDSGQRTQPRLSTNKHVKVDLVIFVFGISRLENDVGGGPSARIPDGSPGESVPSLRRHRRSAIRWKKGSSLLKNARRSSGVTCLTPLRSTCPHRVMNACHWMWPWKRAPTLSAKALGLAHAVPGRVGLRGGGPASRQRPQARRS